MERYEEEVALLVGQSGPLNGQRWALRSTVIIGRDASCEIVVADRQISRQHAKFSLTTNGVLLEDLASKNGTHWNGKPIYEPVIVEDGDVIQVALAQQFVFLSSDATVPLDISGDDLQPILSGATPANSAKLDPNVRLRLEPRSRRVWIHLPGKNPSYDGEMVEEVKEVLPPLSAFQFRLLKQLYDNQGQVVSRTALIAGVWGEEQAVEVSEQALDALVRRLRERLTSIDPTNKYIITVRGHGLRLENPSIHA